MRQRSTVHDRDRPRSRTVARGDDDARRQERPPDPRPHGSLAPVHRRPTGGPQAAHRRLRQRPLRPAVHGHEGPRRAKPVACRAGCLRANPCGRNQWPLAQTPRGTFSLTSSARTLITMRAWQGDGPPGLEALRGAYLPRDDPHRQPTPTRKRRSRSRFNVVVEALERAGKRTLPAFLLPGPRVMSPGTAAFAGPPLALGSVGPCHRPRAVGPPGRGIGVTRRTGALAAPGAITVPAC